jgi:hypothetical protein
MRFLNSTSGATRTEYSLIAAGIGFRRYLGCATAQSPRAISALEFASVIRPEGGDH